jgi:hypothetical protein
MNPTIPILIVFLVSGVVGAGQTPSDQLRQRTGFGFQRLNSLVISGYRSSVVLPSIVIRSARISFFVSLWG